MYDPLSYWEGRSEEWLKATHNTDLHYEWVKPYINTNPSYKVLELGCGDGRWADRFTNYTGVDISPSLVIHCQEAYPDKRFAHHDMRISVTGDFDMIFTFTGWLHVSPEDIAKVKLPDCDYLFVEPHGASQVDYCFQHDYEKLFGVRVLAKHGKLTVYGRFKNKELGHGRKTTEG